MDQIITLKSAESKPEMNKYFPLLAEALRKVRSKKLKIKCGIEIEFYLEDIGRRVSIPDLLQILSANLDIRIIQEDGENQFEIITPVFCLTKGLPCYIEWLRKSLCHISSSYGYRISFFDADKNPGSAMHWHISIHVAMRNVFSVKTEQYEDNRTLLRFIYGLLAVSERHRALDLVARNIFNKHSPAGLCWGGNNRSVAVRVPTSSCRSRRVEYRLPDSNWDTYFVCFLIAEAANISLVQKDLELPFYPRIYGDAHHIIYSNAFLSNREQSK